MKILIQQNVIHHLNRIVISTFTVFRGIYKSYELLPLFEEDFNTLINQYPQFKNYIANTTILFPNLNDPKQYINIFSKIKQQVYEGNSPNTYKILKNNQNLVQSLENTLDNQTQEKIHKKIKLNSTDKATFTTYATTIYLMLKDIFPTTPNLDKIHIIPTYYGANVGFYFSTTKNQNNLKLYIRQDASDIAFTQSTIRAILYALLKQENLTPAQRITIENILIKYSKIAKILNLKTENPNPPGELIKSMYQSSQKVLKSFNLLTKPQDIYIENHTLWIYGSPTNIKLSPTESKLLFFLISNRGQIISYYKIGDLLWPNEPDKFSLWAISQLIHKIRYKLHKAGFPEQKLKNIKGRGYVLER